MHTYLSDRVLYDTDTLSDRVNFLNPDFSLFSGTVACLPSPPSVYRGYDDWVSIFSRDAEQELVKASIAQAQVYPQQRIHIRGISTAESVELLRTYYYECGYEDSLAKNYTLPHDVTLTASLSLSHVLWCEKDKSFLNSLNELGEYYGKITPPVRSPHDLRSLQQALRMGVILGVELLPDELSFLPHILERQILSPFHLSQMIYYRWQKYGFIGPEGQTSLIYPDFSEENSDN